MKFCLLLLPDMSVLGMLCFWPSLYPGKYSVNPNMTLTLMKANKIMLQKLEYGYRLFDYDTFETVGERISNTEGFVC